MADKRSILVAEDGDDRCLLSLWPIVASESDTKWKEDVLVNERDV